MKITDSVKNGTVAAIINATGSDSDKPVSSNYTQCLFIDEKIVYNNDEIKKMLGIGDERLRKFRDEGYLSYVKYPNSDKYWYTKKNILDFLSNPIAIHKSWK